MAFDGDWEKREKEEQSSRRWMLGFAIFLWVGGLMWLTTPLVVFGLITILAGFWPFSGYWKAKKEYEERNEHKQKMMDAFCKAQKQVVVPQRRDLICEGKFYLWLENNVIKIFAAKWEAEYFQLRTIPISDIIFYSREGEVYTETYGYGGGSSYSMVTGWNGKFDPIHISTELKDNRKTILLYQENGKDYALELGHADYLVLKKLIPEKDIVVTSNGKAESKTDSLDDKLKTLKNLYEQELISKEEFETRKEQLLQDL